MSTQIQTHSTEEFVSKLPAPNYLMALSECMWEKAAEVAGPGVTALFQNHAALEHLIDVVEGRREPDADPDVFYREAAQTIKAAWAFFGPGLAEAMEEYLFPGTPVYPDLSG